MDRRTVLAGMGAATVVPLAGPETTATPGRGERTAAGKLILWYDEPATDWESRALPIGNGILGASILGGVADDGILLNEKTLWTGGPGSPGYNFGNWHRPGAIAGVQRAIDERERLAPEEVAAALGQARNGYGSYQPLGTLTLTTDVTTDVEHYRRELDIEQAIARVDYVADGVHHSREYFVSHPDRVVVVRISADRPGQVAFTASLGNATSARGRITLAGALADNGLKYEAQAQINTRGGSRTDNADGSVTVSGADSATIVVAAGTDYADRYPAYRGTDPHARVTETVERASGRTQEKLKAAHVRDHRALFGRVELDLGRRLPDRPTDEVLRVIRPHWRSCSSSTGGTC
ncbi:glycoside hydrolase N-terminal domain-containing protein [Actinoplanes sp. NPDC051494]|uniref:glycoside hydrolase family 95 protein n=1 Tax=Actinoplanes sp. NPDC051494 TaxID=3363907 RepID=UPI00379B7FB1